MFDLAPEPKLNVADVFSPQERIVMLQSDVQEACRELPPELFTLIVSSPPYNLGKSYEKQTGLEQYLAWQEEVIGSLVHLLKPGGSLCWQIGNYVDQGEIFPLDIYFYPLFKQLGLRDCIERVCFFRKLWHGTLILPPQSLLN